MREAGSEMRSPSCHAGCHGLCSCLGLSVLGYELLGQELFACGSLVPKALLTLPGLWQR